MSHLKKQAGPASVELKSEEEFGKFIANHDASIVGEHIFGYFFMSSDLLYIILLLVYSGV